MTPTMGVVAGSFRRGGGGGGGGSAPADVTALITDFGGDSAVLAFFDVRAGITVDTGKVAQWDDARGAVGYAPSLAAGSLVRPDWDSTNLLVVGPAAGVNKGLITANDATFDASGELTLIYVGTCEDGAENPEYYLSVAGNTSASPLLGLGADSGVFSGAIMALTIGSGFQYASSGVARSTTRRVAMAGKGVAGGTTRAQVLSQSANAATSGSGGAISAGNNALTVFGYGGSNSFISSGKGSCRAVIVLDHLITSGEISDLATWATTYHGVTLA